MCCRVNKCCFCIDHVIGVKLLAFGLISVEVGLISASVFYLPHFLFAIGPTSSIGIFCDILLLVASFRSARWFILPWLIYIMIVIVGLCLAAVLQVVIPLGAITQPDWGVVIAFSAASLAIAGLLLYFWLVVLEFFIRLGPPPAWPPMPPPPGSVIGGPYGPYYPQAALSEFGGGGGGGPGSVGGFPMLTHVPVDQQSVYSSGFYNQNAIPPQPLSIHSQY